MAESSLITPLGEDEQRQLLASAEGLLPKKDTVLLRRLLFEVDQLRKRLSLRPERQFPIIGPVHSMSIPWSVAQKAYEAYCEQFGKQQTLEALAQRGGFSTMEMDVLLPGWHHCSECGGQRLTHMSSCSQRPQP